MISVLFQCCANLIHESVMTELSNKNKTHTKLYLSNYLMLALCTQQIKVILCSQIEIHDLLFTLSSCLFPLMSMTKTEMKTFPSQRALLTLFLKETSTGPLVIFIILAFNWCLNDEKRQRNPPLWGNLSALPALVHIRHYRSVRQVSRGFV